MIRDLLNPASGYLELREDHKGVCTVAGLTEVSARSTEEVSISFNYTSPVRGGGFLRFAQVSWSCCSRSPFRSRSDV